MWRIVLYCGVCCSYFRLWYGKFRLQITSQNIIRYLTLHVAHSFDCTKSLGPSRLLNVAEQYSCISSLKVVVQYMAILYKSLHWSLAPLFLDFRNFDLATLTGKFIICTKKSLSSTLRLALVLRWLAEWTIIGRRGRSIFHSSRLNCQKKIGPAIAGQWWQLPCSSWCQFCTHMLYSKLIGLTSVKNIWS